VPLWGEPCPRDIKVSLALVVGRFVYHHHLLSCLSIYPSAFVDKRSFIHLHRHLPSFDHQLELDSQPISHTTSHIFVEENAYSIEASAGHTRCVVERSYLPKSWKSENPTPIRYQRHSVLIILKALPGQQLLSASS